MADQKYSQTATQLQSSSNPTQASPDQLPSVTDADLEPSEWPGPDQGTAEPVPQVDGPGDSPAQRGRLKGGSGGETLREDSGSQPDEAEEGKRLAAGTRISCAECFHMEELGMQKGRSSKRMYALASGSYSTFDAAVSSHYRATHSLCCAVSNRGQVKEEEWRRCHPRDVSSCGQFSALDCWD